MTETSALTKLFAVLSLVVCVMTVAQSRADDPWVVYEGKDGPGKGKHIVLIAGDEEYRSEEAMPMLGKILAVHHGFKCTVLFSTNPDDGTIDPINQTNIPGLKNLESADMMILFLRFRELPDGDMKYIDDFVNSGKPIMGLRTSTHAFQYKRNPDSPYAKYHFRSKEWPGGFGQRVSLPSEVVTARRSLPPDTTLKTITSITMAGGTACTNPPFR